MNIQDPNPPGPDRLSRRRFLRRSAMTSASLAALGSSIAVSPFARVLGANEAVRLGVVGIGSSVKIGGKGKQDIRDFRKIPDVRIVALCDVDRAHLDPQVEQFQKWNEKVEAYDLWSGPAPVLPVMREYLHYDWHWDWHYGNGDLGNMGIHYLDGCRMATGQDRLPRHVISIGGRFTYVDDGQTPNSPITFFDYEPAPVIFEVRGLPKDKSFQKSPWDKNAKATMDTFCGIQTGVTLHCENGCIANNKAFDREGNSIREFQESIVRRSSCRRKSEAHNPI
jgi:hypothetical protein